MSKLMIALFVSAGLGFAGAGAAQMISPTSTSTVMSKEGYTAATKSADAQYKVDKEACESLSANAKDICVAEAKGKDSVAKADAEAAFKHTPKARESARVAHAQASYVVAIEKCDDLAGNPKDVCEGSQGRVRQGEGEREGRSRHGRYAPGRGDQAGRSPQGRECRKARS
jgi:hypothetical protein